MPASLTSLLVRRRVSTVVRWVGCVLLLDMPALADVATGFKETKKDRKEDKKKETGYLPEARSASIRFVAGQGVAIDLGAAVNTLKTVEFVIRQGPQHGQLSAVMPHPTDASRAMVTYTHASAESPLADSFTYSCRIVGESWSAPATISLLGQRMEPKLEIVESPSFARMLVGDERVGRVAVRNRGTAPMSGKITWPEPWVGPATLEVPVGGISEFYVKFQPKNPGEYRQEVVLQPGVLSSRLFLYGDSVLPFSITPSKLELTYSHATGERGATFSMVNARAVAVKVSLALPGALQGPASVEVAPGAKTDVRVWLPSGQVEAFSGKVSATAGTVSASISLDARPSPASMVLVSPVVASLNFGQAYQKESVTREITVMNPGGETLVMEARADSPFFIEDVKHAVRIEPLQKRTFKVTLSPERSGVQTSQVELTSGTGKIKIPLRVEVLEAREAPLALVPIDTTKPLVPASPPRTPPARVLASLSSRPEPTPSPSTPEPAPETPSQAAMPPAEGGEEDVVTFPRRTLAQTTLLSILATQGLPLPKDSVNPYLDPVTEVSLLERNASNLTVSWKKPAVMPSGWVIEFADLFYHQEQNSYAKVWKSYPHWQAVDAGPDQVGIRLNGLRPAGQYEMRILGVDREGKFSQPSAAILLSTADPWRVPGWVWRLMVVGAMGLIAYLLFRVRRGDFLVEA